MTDQVLRRFFFSKFPYEFNKETAVAANFIIRVGRWILLPSISYTTSVIPFFFSWIEFYDKDFIFPTFVQKSGLQNASAAPAHVWLSERRGSSIRTKKPLSRPRKSECIHARACVCVSWWAHTLSARALAVRCRQKAQRESDSRAKRFVRHACASQPGGRKIKLLFL